MTEPGSGYEVPREVGAGVWANVTVVYRDLEYVTIDFVRLDPRDALSGTVVARVVLPPSCILSLMDDLGGFS